MPLSDKTAAVILAAGFSSRMKVFKPLMKLGERRVLDRVVDLYCRAGIADIRVVAGHRSGEIRAALAGRPVTVVENPLYADGMYSSVVAGVKTLPRNISFFFIHPVDIPLVRPHTLTWLLDAAGNDPSPVVYPVFDGRRGHPPLIRKDLENAIADHDGQGGLRALLSRFDAEAREVPVADEGILLDLDTQSDYQSLTARLEPGNLLTEAECRALMRDVQGLPAAIVHHCRQVARVARALAEAINARGGSLDIGLIDAAARVHDVARLEKNHARAGARLLEAMDFGDMAAVVAVHMEIRVTPEAPLDEAQIVHLADKLVAGRAVVDLNRRFDAKLEKFGQDPQAAKAITRRRQAALDIQAKVERAAGSTISQLLAPLHENADTAGRDGL
ncbi:molybdopterin-guanine dinucleotide biosynthesis protein MobA [Desulfosarcina widdelii]|uniref:Molybdopterin-guanine dinucleotide biosynthesis protein MobA n=1 Tax=Desulfosarcina widdelii TaxID=947919 RepID=A0A5K7ZDI0_9BACT|nr:NTP transferase domain-containing protein [Desulfosarcina widdelii]BBO74307.1 molybdopterin-guanine dinucleotide biosynthesis protein MobA [Desulfosarcina widdelii]